jgi:hypothetical protein
MTVRVRVSNSDCVDSLALRLRLAGCTAERKSADTLEVVHAEALDAEEAQLELEFFLRTWQLDYPDVRTELIVVLG